MRIDAKGLHYRDLNNQIRQAIANGEKEIILDNVNGQRYIGAGVKSKTNIKINGVPGNDLAAFMDGPEITVKSNGQDGIGNTMNSGKVTVHGDAGDILGYGMRGGSIFIRGNVGYRVGIHMKSYKNSYPVVIAGGRAGDFLGEYMAGGLLIVLGLENNGEKITGNYVGTGMHGGIIYIRGEVEDYQLGKEVGIGKIGKGDVQVLSKYLGEYARDFDLSLEDVMSGDFLKLTPRSSRPYGEIYAY